MPTDIDRQQVRPLVDDGAVLIDVLPREEYDKAHLAGAVSIPLAVLGKQALKRIPTDQPLIVYCNDLQ